jgi:hypothetical protein
VLDVLVMVNVRVLVCELKSHTTVAVAAFPLFVPVMVIVSACAVADITTKMPTALKDRQKLRTRDITPPCTYLKRKAIFPQTITP